MRKSIGIVFALLLMLALACSAATAEEDAQFVDFTIYLGREEPIQPEYPDLAPLIGEGLTKDDFDITYHCKNWAIDIDENGGLFYDPEYTYCGEVKLYITYTPKVEGVGEEKTFYCTMMTGNKLTYLSLRDKEANLGVGQKWSTNVTANDRNLPKALDAIYDPEVVDASVTMWSNDKIHTVSLIAQGVGETDVVIKGYNGVFTTLHVTVKPAPTELTFAADEFECYVGDRVYLGTSLGVEGAAEIFSEQNVQYGAATWYLPAYCPEGIMEYFVTDKADDYLINVKTYNGFSAQTRVLVYDKTPAADIKLSSDPVRAGQSGVKVNTYDAEGNAVRARYISITKGSDIASVDHGTLITTAPGEIEVTVTNMDGSTVSRTFTVIDDPTQVFLNADELTLEVGDAFNFEVSFDKGSRPYTCSVTFENEEPEYGLFPVVQDGQRVTAQTPGTAVFTVTAGELTCECKITVVDSDKVLRIDSPQEYLKVGQTYQLKVLDRTGKEYPAVYSVESLRPGYGAGCVVTEDGLLKGNYSSDALVIAVLESGIRVVQKIEIAWVPKWIQAESILMRKNDNKYLKLYSDLGTFTLNEEDLIVEITNKHVISHTGGTVWGKEVGKATITLKAKYSDATATFTVEVLDRYSTEYIGTMSMRVPVGYTMPIQRLYDEQGNERIYYWKIVVDNPGAGNPNKSGFKLEDNAITCTWPSASCEIVGARWDGSEKIKLTVRGYQLPQSVYLVPEVLEVPVNGTSTMRLDWDEDGCEVPSVMWIVDNPEIVTCEEYTAGRQENVFQGKKVGTTMVLAAVTDDLYALTMVRVFDPFYDPSVRLPGDADVDGAVTILDALAVLQCNVGWGVEINASNANVDGDEEITILDALRILQHCVGWEVELL